MAPIDRKILSVRGTSMAGAALIPSGILAPRPPPAQPRLASTPLEFQNLLRNLAGASAYDVVARDARIQGGEVHEILLGRGILDPAEYVNALARATGAERLRWSPQLEPLALFAPSHTSLRELRARWQGREVRLLDVASAPPDVVAARVAALEANGPRPLLADTKTFDTAVEDLTRAARIHEAVHGLRERAPDRSAASGAKSWQSVGPVIALGLLAGGIIVLPDATIALVTGLMALPFLCVTILRALAFREVMAQRAKPPRRRRQQRATQLPFYTVLVPLFQEAAVLPDLVASLSAIDYPRERHEVFILIESVDIETQAALLALALPSHFRILQVPDCQPRTKPKALNYALQFARGSMVVIYDAEDRPQPNQLRQAADVFARAPDTLGCAQARLNIYNPEQSWVSSGLMAQTPPRRRAPPPGDSIFSLEAGFLVGTGSHRLRHCNGCRRGQISSMGR